MILAAAAVCVVALHLAGFTRPFAPPAEPCCAVQLAGADEYVRFDDRAAGGGARAGGDAGCCLSGGPDLQDRPDARACAAAAVPLRPPGTPDGGGSR
jgi:hypothetical protein